MPGLLLFKSVRRDESEGESEKDVKDHEITQSHGDRYGGFGRCGFHGGVDRDTVRPLAGGPSSG